MLTLRLQHQAHGQPEWARAEIMDYINGPPGMQPLEASHTYVLPPTALCTTAPHAQLCCVQLPLQLLEGGPRPF